MKAKAECCAFFYKVERLKHSLSLYNNLNVKIDYICCGYCNRNCLTNVIRLFIVTNVTNVIVLKNVTNVIVVKPLQVVIVANCVAELK